MKPDFPSLANEIAEPHPDMNIKVFAFTVNEKSSYKWTFKVWLLEYTISTIAHGLAKILLPSILGS